MWSGNNEWVSLKQKIHVRERKTTAFKLIKSQVMDVFIHWITYSFIQQLLNAINSSWMDKTYEWMTNTILGTVNKMKSKAESLP